jgi:hypothetical protein
MMRNCRILVAALALAGSMSAEAEPYFAVQQGVQCSACHVNATGGGLRTPFGNTWSQRVWPASPVDMGDLEWTGALNRFVALGGNLRVSGTYTDVPDQDTQSEFDVDEMRLYLLVEPLPGRLAIYLDEQLAPGGASNLEAWARLRGSGDRWYLKAGQFYLPYGLRLEDDSAFVRQVPGINMTTPDRGIEVGWETAHASAQVALTNGSGGASETDDGKQLTARTEYVQSAWRVGLGASYNDADAGERWLAGAFAGVRTGPIAWLAEADFVADDSLAGTRREMWVGLLEANWTVAKGHNLKLTAEYHEPDIDVDEDEQNRWSVVWEFTPIQFVQLRVGARIYDGIPQNDLQNRRLGFVQLNGYF